MPLALLAPALFCTLADGAIKLPPFHREDVPNPTFRQELEAVAEAARLVDREAFFKALRRHELELERLTLDTERTLKDARNLRKALEAQGAPTVPKARGVELSEGERLKTYRGMLQAIQQLRLRLDPQRIDAGELKVDLYGGFQFSSLYRDPGQNASFFSKSRPFASLDIRQTFHRPGRSSWLETFSILSFQSSSVEQSEALNIITNSGQFYGEAGAWWMKAMTDGVSWGVVGSLGLQGYRRVLAEGENDASQDQFRTRYRLGLTLRQETGSLKGSFAEWSYLRDPLFLRRDRLWVRGRVVLSQLGSDGASGDLYMEGSVSKASSGRDEATLLVGIRLSTVAFLRSLGAGGTH